MLKSLVAPLVLKMKALILAQRRMKFLIAEGKTKVKRNDYSTIPDDA